MPSGSLAGCNLRAVLKRKSVTEVTDLRLSTVRRSSPKIRLIPSAGAVANKELNVFPSWLILGSVTSNTTGHPLHSRALAHSRAPLLTQPCPHCSHSRAPGEQWARLCVFTLQGCVQAARLCRGSPVNTSSPMTRCHSTGWFIKSFLHFRLLFLAQQYRGLLVHSSPVCCVWSVRLDVGTDAADDPSQLPRGSVPIEHHGSGVLQQKTDSRYRN